MEDRDKADKVTTYLIFHPPSIPAHFNIDSSIESLQEFDSITLVGMNTKLRSWLTRGRASKQLDKISP